MGYVAPSLLASLYLGNGRLTAGVKILEAA